MTQAVFEAADTFRAWDDDYYPPIAERFYDKAVARMLGLIGAGPGQLILDGGCGPGVHSIRAAKAGCRVHAIDLSYSVLDEARLRATRAGVADQIEFEQADLTGLRFEDGQFDHVFSWGVIIHIPTIEKAVDELARIVAPGGRLALYLTNKDAVDHKIEKLARAMLRRPGPKLEKGPLGEGYWCEMAGERLWVWRVDIPAMTRMLESKGFRRTHRVAGEYSEFQRRVKGGLRSFLLRFNNLCYALGLPASPATANLIVFQKNKA